MADGSDSGGGGSGRIPWGPEPEYFVLEDRRPVKLACEHGSCATCWSARMARSTTRVGYTTLRHGELWVETCFLGLQSADTPPGLFFWTHISRATVGPRRSDFVLYVDSCAYVATWGEAEVQHARAVKRAHVAAFPERYAILPSRP